MERHLKKNMSTQRGYKKRGSDWRPGQSNDANQGKPNFKKASKKKKSTTSNIGNKNSKMLQHRGPPPPSARILWGNSAGLRPENLSRLVQDKTWGLSFAHYSPVLTDFSVKAGSKKMILTSSTVSQDASGPQSPTKGRMSEDQLLRKYRYFNQASYCNE